MISAHKIISSLVLIQVHLQKCFQVRRNKDLIRSSSLRCNTRELLPASCIGIKETPKAPQVCSLTCSSSLLFKNMKNLWHLPKTLESRVDFLQNVVYMTLIGLLALLPLILSSSMGCSLNRFQNPSVYFVTKTIYFVI